MASVYQCSAARATTMPTRRSKRRPSFDPAEASVLGLKALARGGELPGCKCYRELREEEFLRAAPCEHVLTKAADVLLAKAEKSKPPARTPRPATPPAYAPAAAYISLIRSEAHNLLRMMESDESLTDEEIEQIDAALEKLEPTRGEPSDPSEALTKEALIAVYGARYDRGENFYCPQDAIQRRKPNAGRPEGETGHDLRFGIMELPMEDAEGNVRWEERTVVQRAAGQIEILGKGKKAPQEQEGGKTNGF